MLSRARAMFGRRASLRCPVGVVEQGLRVRRAASVGSVPEAELELFRVPDLRYLLRFAGLPASGGRAALEERLQQHGDMEISLEGKDKAAHNFGSELKAVLAKVPQSERVELLCEAIKQLDGEGQLEELVRTIAEERVSAASCVAEVSAVACVLARLRSQVHVSQPARTPSPSVVRGLGIQHASQYLKEQEEITQPLNVKSEQEPAEAGSVVSQRRSAILGFDLRKYGVGGVSPEAQLQLQQALLSHALTDPLREQLGMSHQSGLLFFGPPGCGKTLIAHGLSKALCATTVQYVTAADINAKWFGESDQRMHALFNPGRKSREEGRNEDLHLIVMDEIDALAAARSGSDVRNHESALNVLLACMDGFEENDRTLVLGLTNRREKIDAALLRPGRFGVQIEVAQPDVNGRLEVLCIHTQALSDNGFLAEAVSLSEIANRTEGFSGADLRQLVDSATAHALLQVDEDELKSGRVRSGLVGKEAFQVALDGMLRARSLS
eukprot:TRINITY_DN26502_c0_g1_i2.p1 TRINITY_DN26502_c0_g1~~TRINITY_DN26502_c0_g1_i2.p1  ORF type:complete len:496 (-),score=90.89 TRINITY_DN26502_c0_g1_i2:48-1535(-)